MRILMREINYKTSNLTMSLEQLLKINVKINFEKSKQLNFEVELDIKQYLLMGTLLVFKQNNLRNINNKDSIKDIDSYPQIESILPDLKSKKHDSSDFKFMKHNQNTDVFTNCCSPSLSVQNFKLISKKSPTSTKLKLSNNNTKTITGIIPIFLIEKCNKKKDNEIPIKRHRKPISECMHIDREYYAKGMCRNCYHRKGVQSVTPTKCMHTLKAHYAKGLCKNCYLYNSRHKVVKKIQNKQIGES